MTEGVASVRAEMAAVRAPRRPGQYFYFGASLVMLTTVLAAFSPTFYLRGLIVPPAPLELPLPPYMVVHGVVMTAWYLFFVAQSWFAASGSIGLHRRTGWVGAALAVAVLAAGGYIAVNTLRVRVAAGFTPEQAIAQDMHVVTFVNLVMLTVFAALVAAAMLLRRRREWHGRLMYWAFVLSMAAAFGGNGSRLLEPLFEHYVGVPPFLVGMFVAFLAMVIHDFRTRRRIHKATLIGFTINFFLPIPLIALADSEAGRALYLGAF
jgi:hypothetical protein